MSEGIADLIKYFTTKGESVTYYDKAPDLKNTQIDFFEPDWKFKSNQ